MNHEEIGVQFGKWFLRGVAIALGFMVVTFAVGGVSYFVIKNSFETKIEQLFNQDNGSTINDEKFIIETPGEYQIKSGTYTITNLGDTGSLDIKDKKGNTILYKIFDDKNKTYTVKILDTDKVNVEGTELEFVRE